MRTPWDRVRLGATVLVLTLIAFVVGYRLAGWSWIDSIYMVVITVSTVGYREVHELDVPLQVFTIFVIVLGMTAAAFTFGNLTQLVIEGEVNRLLGRRRMTREIEHLNHHIIVCGFGRMGHLLADALHHRNEQFVVIDSDPARIVEAEASGYLASPGDATEEDTLIEAGIERAKSLVTALPNDAANVFITLTSRNLNKNLQIIARGEYPSTQKKLIQAGADRVVLAAAIGAQRIAAMLTRPTAVELLELVAGQGSLDVEIDGVSIAPGSALVGTSVEQAETDRRRGLLIVAVKREDGEMFFNPPDDFLFAGGDSVVMMGKTSDIERFRTQFRL